MDPLRTQHRITRVRSYSQYVRDKEEPPLQNKAELGLTCIEAPSTRATHATRSRNVTATGTATKKPLQKALKYLLSQPWDCAIPRDTRTTSRKLAKRKQINKVAKTT